MDAEEPDDDRVRQALDDARDFAKSGEWERALERHEWFHANALRLQPSMRGVRLSYALRDWMRLAEQYPPAAKSLESIRNRTVEAIFSGTADYRALADVRAIDDVLENAHETVAVFRQLDQRMPEFAINSFRFVDRCLLELDEDELFLKHCPDLIAHLDREIDWHLEATSCVKASNDASNRPKETTEHQLALLLQGLQATTQQLVDLARRNGKEEVASQLIDRCAAVSEKGDEDTR